VVFTGVSGSGKSSLAFGTLYTEAQRRYLESVAPYARRLFHQMGIPASALPSSSFEAACCVTFSPAGFCCSFSPR
jgi:hypothetical protein